MHILIMGPPGAGKGTQAARVADYYTIPAISTGDIFRSLQTSESPLAHQVRSIMASGSYISDEITDEIVTDRLNRGDCRRGFLLDGYPRTVGQVVTLDRLLATGSRRIDAVVALTADDDAITERLLDRARIQGRTDDNPETIRVRLKTYRQHTAPLLDAYSDRGLVVEVDGVGAVDEITARIQSGIAGVPQAAPPAARLP